MLSRGFGDILCFGLVRRCFEISVKKKQGYSLFVFITFDDISDSLKTDSNISYGREECSIDVLATYFASDYLSDVLKYR